MKRGTTTPGSSRLDLCGVRLRGLSAQVARDLLKHSLAPNYVYVCMENALGKYKEGRLIEDYNNFIFEIKRKQKK